MEYFPGKMKPEQPGVNGVRYAAKTNYLYYTATAKKLFMRVKVNPETLELADSAELVVAGKMGDDFFQFRTSKSRPRVLATAELKQMSKTLRLTRLSIGGLFLMGNKEGKELAQVRPSPEGSYTGEDEEFERAVARDAGWPGQLEYWWRHLRWPRVIARGWKMKNGFFWLSDYLVISFAVIFCVLCSYTLRKNWQQQQIYEKTQNQFLKAATSSVTEFQRAKSELQAATVRMQALNDERTHDLSILATLYDTQRPRLERNSAKSQSAVSDVEEIPKKTTMGLATIPGLPGEEQVHRRPHPKRKREALAPTPDPAPLLKPGLAPTPSPRPMAEGMSLYNSDFTQPFKNP